MFPEITDGNKYLRQTGSCDQMKFDPEDPQCTLALWAKQSQGSEKVCKRKKAHFTFANSVLSIHFWPWDPLFHGAKYSTSHWASVPWRRVQEFGQELELVKQRMVKDSRWTRRQRWEIMEYMLVRATGTSVLPEYDVQNGERGLKKHQCKEGSVLYGLVCQAGELAFNWLEA